MDWHTIKNNVLFLIKYSGDSKWNKVKEPSGNRIVLTDDSFKLWYRFITRV